MKTKLFILLFLLSMNSLFAFSNHLTIGTQFSLRHNYQKDQYIDGLNLQLSYPVTNRFDIVFSATFDEWRSGRERPALAYDYEYSYRTTILLGGIRYSLTNRNNKISPYVNLLYGTCTDNVQDNWNYYSLDRKGFPINKTTSHQWINSDHNICIGLGYTFHLNGSLFYDMSFNYNTNYYTNLLIGLNYMF